MTNWNDEQLPEDLRSVAERVRAMRPEPTPLQLDRVKVEAKARASRGTGRSASSPRGAFLKPSLKSPLVMALTLGVFLALAGGTLAVTGAFDGNDGDTVNAAQDQYDTNEPGGQLGATGESERSAPGGAGDGAGDGAGVGAGVGAGAGTGGGTGAGAAGLSADVDAGLCPYTLKILSGTLTLGEAPDLCFLDGHVIKVKSDSPTDWVATFRGSELNGNVSSLGVMYDGDATKSCDQTTSLFDYTANNGKGDWTQISSDKSGPDGVSFVKTPEGDNGRFTSNGEAKVRVKCVNDDADFTHISDRLRLLPE